MSFAIYTSALVSVSEVSDITLTSAVTEAPFILAIVRPIITVVVELGTVFILTNDASIPALVFNLNVFAIAFSCYYPRAIDIATASGIAFICVCILEVTPST